MKTTFLQQLIQQKEKRQSVPSNSIIHHWIESLLDLIFPERNDTNYYDLRGLELAFQEQQLELENILRTTKGCQGRCCEEIASNFFEALPELYRKLKNDLDAILSGDPAAIDYFEIIRCYPGFYAIANYRIAHELYMQNIPYIPRIITENAHSKTGIDIHPAAKIGEYLFIDHGTGIVIGETSVIGNHVKLYQGVTLGALSVEKSFSNTKRHPSIGDYVIIYAGATILGGKTNIGNHSIIGGSAWLTKSVPPNSTIYHQPNIRISETEKIE